MNKSELINVMAEKSGLTKEASKKALEAFVESVTEELKEGGKISIIGFGTFSVSERAERVGTNPSTKEKIVIAAKKVAKFKPGADLAL
ncbi:MAG: HU family DNA-binding protein [Bacteroidales bacterium]